MNEEEEDSCASEQCLFGEDEHGFSLKMVFHGTDNEEGQFDCVSAEVKSHLHNVPIVPVVQSTLAAIQAMLIDEAIKSEPICHMPEHLRQKMGGLMAKLFITQILNGDDVAVDYTAFQVPDDISELLGD